MLSSPVAVSPATHARPRMGVWEKAATVLLLLLLLVLKVNYIYSLSINSDEGQHLHVAWGWTQGMVQYRDFFDNHTPLFHLAMAPLLQQLGERSDILTLMRFAMLPFFVGTLGCIGWLGTRLYSARAGFGAALLTATTPLVLAATTQFRTDVLWMMCWFATLAVALTGPFSRKRAFATGLLLGITFGVSMKTTLLLASLLCSWGMVFALSAKPERKALLQGSLGKMGCTLAGLCVAPAAIGGLFAAHHAIPDLIYCVFKHNAIISQVPGARRYLGWAFPFLLLLTAWLGRFLLRAGPDRELAARRTLVLFTGILYFILLFCFWPLVTRQDYLPGIPLLALSVAPLLVHLGKNKIWLLMLVVGIQFYASTKKYSPFACRISKNKILLDDVLRLTKPSDFVMDAKGETIFRRRPFYYALENITQRRISLGLIADTIAAEMLKTRTCVVILERLPEKTLQWVKQHYVPLNEDLWVAGCFLPPTPEPGAERRFEVGIPTEYVVSGGEAPLEGKLDGVAYTGPVFLTSGMHTFTCTDPRPLAVFWAQAAAKGYTPQNLRP
ncbi:MAG: glycosyltransferase family 39 protein [Verrucomicrobia bacterium]|nr:glycosyltransferase family 39 protein [Verrucomicrobiota bacterium]